MTILNFFLQKTCLKIILLNPGGATNKLHSKGGKEAFSDLLIK